MERFSPTIFPTKSTPQLLPFLNEEMPPGFSENKKIKEKEKEKKKKIS